MKPSRRKRKLINVRAQAKIACEIVIHAVLLILLLMLITYAPPFATMFSELPLETHQSALLQLLELNVNKWPLMILVLLYLGITSVLFSHHLTAPALRFREVLRAMLGGRLNIQVELRRNDYMRDIAQDFNNLIGKLQRDIDDISSHAQSIQDEISQLNQEEGRKLTKSMASLEAIERICKTYDRQEPEEIDQ